MLGFNLMKIFFCPECGGYSLGPASSCDECQAALPEDSWAEVTEEELQQLQYIEDFHLPEGVPMWEYDVIKLQSDDRDGRAMFYTTTLLKKMGDTGWELIEIIPLSNNSNSKYAVFKRPWENVAKD